MSLCSELETIRDTFLGHTFMGYHIFVGIHFHFRYDLENIYIEGLVPKEIIRRLLRQGAKGITSHGVVANG